MSILEAKTALDKVITKSRVHFYKPIQIAEILFHHRVNNAPLDDVLSYKNTSKAWRDEVTLKLVGRVSTSSARYQDDLFNANAVPPEALGALAAENKRKHGIVEAYIYQRFSDRFSQMSEALDYCSANTRHDFDILTFIQHFYKQAGLKRSIDKIYEIIVYSLFSVIIESLETKITLSINPKKMGLLEEFSDFATMIMGISVANPVTIMPARIFRIGVTNAADRGLDMIANFGMAIQIKHLSLTEELAENIVTSVMADRIVIVCKEGEKNIILSLLNQIGWKSRIQSIITENDLQTWYQKALRGSYSDILGDTILSRLAEQIQLEFPSTVPDAFNRFLRERGYKPPQDNFWKI